MSSDVRHESPRPKFRAVLSPELEGVDTDEEMARSVLLPPPNPRPSTVW
jgi:hypothetical protein